MYYQCSNCGYVFNDEPDVCPICDSTFFDELEDISGVEPNQRMFLVLDAMGKDPEKGFIIAKKLADAGAPQIQTMVGSYYCSGVGCKKDPEKGVQYFRRAADNGELAGMMYLGRAYETGVGVEKNLDYAERLFMAASERGYGPTMRELALLYLNEKPDDANARKLALNWLQKASENGVDDADLYLGSYYATFSEDDPKSKEKAFAHYKKAAEAGLVKAMTALAACYQLGVGTGKNVQEAIKWYELALTADDAEAAYALGELYYFGDVEPDGKKSMAYFERALELGDPDAAAMIAGALMDGDIIPRDINRAVELLTEYMDKSPICRNTMGEAYEFEPELGGTPEQAFKLYEQAAKESGMCVFDNYCRCLIYGIGCKKDVELATNKLKDACKVTMSGDPELLLGLLAYKAHDTEGAMRYFKSSENKGNDRAKPIAEAVKAGKTVDESIFDDC